MKTEPIKEQQKKIQIAAFARMRQLTSQYYAKPRTDSLHRFIGRITKPKAFRYQSLLRGAMRAKRIAKQSNALMLTGEV